jgi:hypothetical protein
MAIAVHTSTESRQRWSRFFAISVIATVVALGMAFGLIKGTELAGRHRLPNQVLIDYQKRKLAGPVGDVVFLGDSSLGTAVDASLWKSLTGKTASNFALTGSHGYAGTLDMLRAILKHHSPTDVVIVQTAAMMRRTPKEHVPSMSPDETGYFQRLRERWLETMNINEFVNSAEFLMRRLQGSRRDSPALDIENDYVRQLDRRADGPKPNEFDPASINEANLLTLNAISALCREKSLTCVYLHGPLISPHCTQQTAYFGRVNALILSSGLQLALDHPPCLSSHEVGNTYDHTKPSSKDDMTRRFAEILKPFLSK